MNWSIIEDFKYYELIECRDVKHTSSKLFGLVLEDRGLNGSNQKNLIFF